MHEHIMKATPKSVVIRIETNQDSFVGETAVETEDANADDSIQVARTGTQDEFDNYLGIQGFFDEVEQPNEISEEEDSDQEPLTKSSQLITVYEDKFNSRVNRRQIGCPGHLIGINSCNIDSFLE
jgi:hypothetical protein